MGCGASTSRVHSLRGERDDGFLTPSKATPGLLQKRASASYLPNLRLQRVARIPVDFAAPGCEQYRASLVGRESGPSLTDYSPELALLLALACGMHERHAANGRAGLRDCGLDGLLAYVDANDETIWPTEHLKNGVITFADGRLGGSIFEFAARKTLVLVFGSPVDEASADGIAALLGSKPAKHPDVAGSLLAVLPDWELADKAVLNTLKNHKTATGEHYEHVLIAGHGVGAALAIAAAASLKIEGALSAACITVYTFGAPMCTDHTFCDSYDVLIKHTWRLTAEDDAVPSLPSAVTSSADSPPCHVGKWVHLNRLGAWVVRGEPAALTKDAAEEVSKRPDAPKAHSAAAYCSALQRACNPSAELAAAVGKFVAGDAP